jgi:diguanylate cyclase (GGDEF)-like protein
VASSFSSLVNLPIVNDGKLVANLLFATGPDGRRLGQSEFSVLQIVAGQVAIALSKAEREEQFVTLSLTDQLTGLYNRQAFDERLQHEIARFRRYQYRQENHLTCVRVDILSFKHFNQKFGYQVGDVILQLFAELLKSCVREVDYIVRLYANEFMMVLPETDEQGAGIVAGRIREKMLDANSFDTSIEAVLGQAIILDEQYQLDCALGIVEFPQESSKENELVEMLAKAEQVLERAKKCSDRMALWSDMNKPLPPVEQSELA